jgi:hypothetical protein
MGLIYAYIIFKYFKDVYLSTNDSLYKHLSGKPTRWVSKLGHGTG